MKLLPDQLRSPSPWKNGGGVTREIAAFPIGAGLDQFEWRLSLATVASAGPFSLFPGVDRILAVVEGGPLVLNFGDGQCAVVHLGAHSFEFAGDRPVDGKPVDNELTDLNLLVRRGVRGGALERHNLGGRLAVGGGSPETIVVALDRVELDQGGILEPRDAVWLEPGESVNLLPLIACARVMVATIWEIQSPA